MSTELSVEAKGIVRRFGEFTAVDHIDLAVPWGSIFGFLGANGAGKTTTIRMLCGLLAFTEGTATVAGVDAVRHPEKVKERIGYMAQKFSLYADLTVLENLQFFADAYLVPRRSLESRIHHALETTALKGEESRLTRTLPVGIKQRLALACSLVHEPRVLFLDEPTAGVDPLSRRNFWRLIHQLSDQGVTVFVTTHHLDEAENCHEVLFMQAGRQVGLGSPRELRDAADTGDLVKVRVADPASLRANPRVREASAMGAHMHVRLRSAADVGPLAEELGVPVHCIRPSLEDVFLEACRVDREARSGGAS